MLAFGMGLSRYTIVCEIQVVPEEVQFRGRHFWVSRIGVGDMDKAWYNYIEARSKESCAG